MSGEVWAALAAVGDRQGGGARVPDAAWEVFGAAHALAGGLGASVSALLLGEASDEDLARARGLAGHVVHATGGGLATGSPRAIAAAAAEALKGREPSAVLSLADAVGREWAPRLAVRLGGAPLTEIGEVSVKDGLMVFGRPVFGGKAVASLVAEALPAVATIKAGAFATPEPAGGEGSLETVAAPDMAPDVDVLSREAASVEGVPLPAAPVVVSGGRGMGGPEPFRNELKELAELLGGAVGASLAAVDAGWVPQSMQVGQTGTAVSPTVYLAVGISGASQHLAGIGGARHVVALNKDRDAPIFRVAEVGIVGDHRALLPEIIRAVRAKFG